MVKFESQDLKLIEVVNLAMMKLENQKLRKLEFELCIRVERVKLKE